MWLIVTVAAGDRVFQILYVDHDTALKFIIPVRARLRLASVDTAFTGVPIDTITILQQLARFTG